MKTRIPNALRWCVRRVPEALLAFFLVALLPLLLLAARGVLVQVQASWAARSSTGSWLWANIGQTLAVILCVLGTTALVYLLWKNWGIVWAVARKLILEALHRKVVLVLLVFFIVLMPALPFVLTAEGSQKSQVHFVLLYSLVLALVLLSLLAIFMTTASICSEVERKQVHITDPKPLMRWQFLLGKWFGAFVLCAAVLAVMTAGTYVLVSHVARPPDLAKLPVDERLKAQAQWTSLAYEVFVARRSVSAALPDVSKEARELALEELETQTIAWAVNSAERRHERRLLYRSQTCPGGGGIAWRFGGLEPRQDGLLFIRFKAYLSGGIDIRGQWQAFRMQAEPTRPGESQTKFKPVLVGVPVNSPATGWQPNTAYEVSMPARYISPDGSLWLRFVNADPSGSVIFDIDQPVEVLQREEGFAPNYYRSLAIVMIHVALLAALGVMAGALFSFPVASLVVTCLFIGGIIGPWFTAEFVEPDIYARLTTVTIYLERAWRAFAGGIMALMPNFGRYNPFGDLVDGKMVSMGVVATAGSVLFFIKGGLALLVGFYFYSRRELAKTVM